MVQLYLVLLEALCALMILLHLCLQIITPFTIYFNARFIYQRWELWRLLTNFMFFGSLGGHSVYSYSDSQSRSCGIHHLPYSLHLCMSCRRAGLWHQLCCIELLYL